MTLEPAAKLLYTQQGDVLDFWANGEAICVSTVFEPYLQRLANAERFAFDEQFNQPALLQDIALLLNNAVLMLLPPNE